MGRLIDALLRRVARTGFRRGLGGGHWAWFLIAGSAYALQRARRPDGRTEQLRLRPGDRYLVTVLPGGRGGRGRRDSGHPDPEGTAPAVGGAEGAYRTRPMTG